METAPNHKPLSLQQNGSQPQLVPLSYVADVPDPDEEELDLGQLFAAIRRRVFLIAVVAVGVTGAVGIWTSYQPEEYEGKFQLLVEPVTDQGDKLSSRLAGIVGNLGMNFIPGQTSGLDYESQVAVLQSPKLMDQIIQQLKVKYDDIEYKTLVGGEKPPLTIERLNKTTKIIEVRYRDEEPEKIQFVLETLKDSYLKYSREDRQSNIRNGLQFIEEQLPQMRQRVDTLQENLQKFRQQYGLIDPEIQGKQLAEQVTKLDDQLLDAQAQLFQQERLYDTLQRQIGLDPSVAIASSALSEAPSYQTRLNKLKELESQIAKELGRFTENTPQIQAMLEERNKLEFLLRQDAAEVLGSDLSKVASNPQAQTYQNSVRRELIQQMVNAASQVEVMKVRNQVLAQAAGMLSQYREKFPIIVRQYTDLMRELAIATQTLNQLLAQREALRVEGAQNEVPWELIAKPEIPLDEEGNPIPVSPNLVRNLVLGAMLGLMLGLGAALLAERLDHVFHNPEDLKEATRSPLLGIIPASESAKQLASATWVTDSQGAAEFQNKRDFTFMEAFRSLNTKIRFLNADQPVRSMTISSAIAAEGKSTVAVNLAHAAASMGKRVLLVDADLRWPQVHARLGILNSEGLTNVLATNLDWQQAIQRSPVEDNLFVLTAGPLPPDPIRLLSSQKMQHFMKQWSTEFDLVIYDTPPLLNVVDSRVLAASTDGIGLVVSISHTDRDLIIQTIEDLKTSGITVLGVIGNGVKGRSLAWYDDSHRYYQQNTDREILQENTIKQ